MNTPTSTQDFITPTSFCELEVALLPVIETIEAVGSLQDTINAEANLCTTTTILISEEVLISRFTCGENISGGRVVVSINNLLFYFDPTNLNHYGLAIGISRQAGLIGEIIDVATNGKIYYSGLGLTPNSHYFSGLNGQLTTVPINTHNTILQPAGAAIDSDTLIIDFLNPVINQ